MTALSVIAWTLLIIAIAAATWHCLRHPHGDYYQRRGRR